MMAQYEKFVAMSKDGTWKRMPNHKHLIDDIPKQMRPEPAAKKRDGTRCFLRNVYTEGLGFEFVMFFSASEKRVVSIFQPGLYLEGLTGYMHGGAIATILDNTLAACSLLSTGRMITANLSINYRSPVPLGSVVLVDTKVDRTEGRKTFVSGQVQSVDGQVLHVDATALCIKLESKNSPQQQARSSGSPEST
ncbi:acyl-coenzyme A thioesterase THEM4-like isoform X2 [Rhineura floridana]|nr:acyl-coenzyme A thioesterase THEM4-like isoform X2 [Rhineura floridana]